MSTVRPLPFRPSSIAACRSVVATLALFLSLVAAGQHPAAAQSLVHVAVSHIPAQVADAKPLGRKAATPQMTVEFVLPLRNQAQLQDELNRIYDPKDPLYGKYRTSQEFADAYGPSVTDVSAVTAFAKSKGLSLASVSGNKTLLQVTGSSSAVEAAFGVHLNNYQAADGRVFFAPDSEPVFPADIARRIVGVNGLDNALIYHPYSHMEPKRPTMGSLPAFAQPLGGAQPGAIYGSDPEGNVAPSDFKSIYNIPSVTSPGSGQTLAVYELDGYTPSDIADFNNYYYPNVTAVPLQNVLVDGYDGSAGGGAGEVTLDIEMMIGQCPYATKIICYEAPNGSGIVDLYARIASDNLASIISSSWGGPETGTSPTSAAMSENQSFQQMAMQGQSFFDASGDAGAYANETSSSKGTLSVQDPGDQPYATAVGGTLLNDTTSYAYSSESAWGDSNASDPGSRGLSGAGSGGGISAWFPIPSYQDGFINASNKGSTTQRNVPDLSLFGDYDEGYYSVIFQGSFGGSNGTSAAAPLWAAYMALVDQGRASHGSPKIGFVNPAVYSLAANATTYANDFHDINDGTNNLYYPAVTGYDLATGIGSPKGTALYNDLVAYGTTSAPAITSFTPTSGPVGTSVTITGTAFTGATAVKFNGTAATTFHVVSATSITATVPTGATTGKISVTAPGGTGTSSASFTVTTTSAPPTITGFSPTSGPVGTTVVITGTNLTGTTVVGFTNAHATSFTVNSSTQITTSVPSGAATGTIAVATPGGEAKSTASFTVTAAGPPTITSFTPTSGPIGTSVTITGTNLTGATAVKFNTTAATTFSVASATSMTATVPSGATTGKISVTTSPGTATSSSSFTITASSTPTITGFSPTSGPVGTTVVITGTNLTGATVVGFQNEHATSFTVNSSTQITTTVPSGAATGPIAVATPGGTAKSTASFTVTTGSTVPTITGFSPTSGPVGTTVVITGTNLTGATVVGFQNEHATSFTVNSSTQITTTVPSGAATGPIAVATPGGTAKSTTSFTVTTGSTVPTITGFSPTSGPVGTTVVITGTNLTGATVVGFQNEHATSFTVNSSTQITTTVPSGAATGPIAVATPAGTAKSTTSFTVTTAQTVALSNITASPTSVMSGGASTITVTLTGAAPSGGASVALTINGSAQSPLVVPAGQTSLATSFTINGNPGTLTFTATYGGVSKTATVTITAPAVVLSGFAASPTTVAPGGAFSLAAVLSADAPAGGASVTLTQNGTAQNPIVIAAGQTTGTTNYTAGSTAGTYTFVASYGGVSKTVTVTVMAPATITLTNFYFSPSSVPGGGVTTGYVVFSHALTSAISVEIYDSFGLYDQFYTLQPGYSTYEFSYTSESLGSEYVDTFTASTPYGDLNTDLDVTS